MKLFVATALLLWAFADAHHIPEHNLDGPPFKIGKTHVYDVNITITSGIPGLSAQKSKAVMKCELNIYAKSSNEYLMKITNVYSTDSLESVPSDSHEVPLRKNRELEDHLSTPTRFTYENGKVTMYSLDSRETLESKKIKKSILRSLEMYVEQSARDQLKSDQELPIPITYNLTRETPMGYYDSRYFITVSPYPDFPYEMNVYNISRTDNYETIRYPSHYYHHNFQSQGCPEVCQKDKEYDAGCPVGYEPHKSPVQMSFIHKHHMFLYKGVMIPEIIETTETHLADMYDQNMEIKIRSYFRFNRTSDSKVEEPSSGAQTFTDLEDFKTEINEREINEKCESKSPREAIETVKRLLKEVASVVVSGDLEDRKSYMVGEKLILMQKALQKLKVSDLKIVEESIEKLGTLRQASDEEKVKRQIWMDLLPLIGTEESVTYIAQYIKEGIKRSISVMEAKEILEALPSNIIIPSEKNIHDLKELLELEHVKRHHVLHSAAHLVVARIVGKLCNSTYLFRPEAELQSSSWFGSYHQALRNLRGLRSSATPLSCPETLVRELIENIANKLKNTDRRSDIAIYLETLSHMSVPEILPILAKYTYGMAEELEKYSPSFIDFVKTIALYSLHNIVNKQPEEVLEIVIPVYFNKTEAPKIRTAAFGVLIRASPSLSLLQHIAQDTWKEPSREVGSFVTSTLETFGNSTLPCLQHTASRIKKVIAQAKRFDIGIQHAKNIHWSYFDELRRYGLEQRLEYIPSNESIIPSAVYGGLAYSFDSLKDVLFQTAANMQGFSQDTILKVLEQHILGLKVSRPIEEETEREIFSKVSLQDRVPETMRATVFRKLFYASSYYYLEGHTLWEDLQPLITHLQTYLSQSDYDYSGHLVKVFLPSSHHTKAIAKTLPFPVEFQMKHPLIVALKIKSTRKGSPSLSSFGFHIRPSVYLSKLYTHQMKNLADCKEIGVYREHKIAVSYPFEIKLSVDKLGQFTLKYKMPELPKKVATFHSEAGTFAGKATLDTLPFTEHKETIKTLPSQFKKENTLSFVGVPPVHTRLYTEDITEGYEDIPRTMEEAWHLFITKICNAGWRRKSVNITIYHDSVIWPKETEVTVDVEYSRAIREKNPRPRMFQSDLNSEWPANEWSSESEQFERETLDSESWIWNHVRVTEEKWAKGLKPEDNLESRDPRTYIQEGKKLHYKLVNELPHAEHVLDVKVHTEPKTSSGYFRVEYNHTLGKFLQLVHIDAAANLANRKSPLEISIDHGIAFFNRPNEFKYDDKIYGEQKGLFLSTFSMNRRKPYENVDAIVKGVFGYESMDNFIRNELVSRLSHKHFLPESQEFCLKDVQEGKALSLECMKAIREMATYNKLKMKALWIGEVPETLRTIAAQVDTVLKYKYFSNMELQSEKNQDNALTLNVTYMDKLIDEPVYEIELRKPKETIKIHKVDTEGVYPASSIHALFENYYHRWTNNTYPASCAMMEKYVRTYDLKEYPLPEDACTYVVSTHCTDDKKFVVLAKMLAHGNKEITVHVAHHKVVMSPKRNGYQVMLDGSERSVDLYHPLILSDDYAEIHVFHHTPSDGKAFLELHADWIGLKVKYDGKNIEVTVNPIYKGELCGLCSEFDGEMMREYRGLDRCLFTHSEDFARNAIIDADTCGARTEPQHQHKCPSEEGEPRNNNQYVPRTKRNLIRSRREETCFSVLPYPMCEDNATPVKTRREQVGFHCLPKSDVTAKKLLKEAKRRILGELAGKSEDFTETVEVPALC